MTIKNLSNIAIPDQPVLDTSSDAGFNKIQAVNGRLYNNQAMLANKDEFSDLEEQNPSYIYTSGDLTRINYASGNYKLFTYVSGNLTQLDFVKGTKTYRKTFNYDLSGNLTSISFSVLG